MTEANRTSETAIVEDNPQANHYAHLYRDAHKRAEVMGRRYGRILEGVEAVMATIDRDKQDEPVYVLLAAVVAASRWDGENQ